MAALVKAKDWSKTPLGPADQWPQSLRVAVGICLGSRFPMFLWWGPNLINIYNDAYIPILGRRHPDALGGSAPDLWREVWPVIGPQIEAVITRGEASWQQRVPLVLERNGYPEEAYFTWSHSPVPGDDGQVGGVLCVVSEETSFVLAERERARLVEEQARVDEDRKRTEADREHLAAMVNASRDGIFAIDIERRVRTWNPAAERLFGYRADEVVGKDIGIIVPPDRLDEPKRLLAQIVRGERVPETETVRVRKDGSLVDVSISLDPVFDAEGRVVAAAAMMRDIGWRKRAEAALRVEQERFRALFERAAVGMAEVDLAGRFVRVNAEYGRITGYAPAELVGRPTSAITHPDDVENDTGLREAMFREGGGTMRREKRYVRQDGAVVWVDLAVTLVRDDAGRPTHHISSVADITARKRSEEQLRRSHDTFYHLIENAPFGVYVVDADFRLAQVSLGAQKVFGNIRPLLGRDFTEVLRAVWVEPFATEAIGLFRRTLDTGEPYRSPSTVEQRQDTPEVEAYDWRIERISLPDGRFGVVCYFYDLSERQRWEAALGASEARRSTALAIAHLGTFEWDLRTHAVMLDDRSREIFGFGPGEGTRPEEVFARIDPADFPRVSAEVEASRRSLSRLEVEYRINLPDGAVRVIVSISDTIPGRDGEAERMFGVFADATERRRAEAAVREMAERIERQSRLFERIASTTPDFIYVFNLDGRFLYANRRLLEVWGRTFEDAVGKSMYELGYPEWHADMHMAEIRQVIETKLPIRGEVPFTGGSGISGVYEYIFTPVLDLDGEVEVIAGTTRDVTERKRAEEERRRLSAERDQQLRTFDTVLASLQEFVFLLDPAGRFTYANKPLLNLWKKTPAEAFGKTFAELGYPPELVALHEAQMAEVIRTRHPVRGENEYTSLEGRIGRYEYIFVPLFAEDGSVEAIGGATRDVTEQRRHAAAREELLASERAARTREQAARTEAERQSRVKDEFLATLSHELRTPLNAILGWSQVLRSGRKSDPEDMRRGLETIERNARAQTRIIEDLLDMSRIISGKIRLDVQPVHLGSVLEAAAGTVRHAADAKGVRLQVELDPDAGPVAGDPARLQQVFWNLLSNSVKHGQRGGRVEVRLTRADAHLEVCVTDDGEGISPEFLPHVFDRFRQADSTTTRRHGGLGLGLSIVKQLVELHGGTIRATSPGVGQGATFTVTLPRTPVRQEPEPDGEPRHARADVDASASHEACAALAGVRVLVVDDEPDARALVERLLSDCEAAVMTAASASEALGVMRRERPDIMVSDIGMPGEDGYSLIRKVRALEPAEGGDVLAVALTAYARSEDRTRAMEAGFQTHVAKPVEPAELVAVVAALARRARRH